MFRIAHISDLHIPPMPGIRLGHLASKRLLGLFSWHRKWKTEHEQIILEALLAHIHENRPDHICITGDITYTTLPEEVDKAAEWMSGLGDPHKISLIPGNHDAYVPGALDYAMSQWSRWMQDDEGSSGFPFLHRRGPVDIIGLSSAVPSLPALSLGRIGAEQLARTEDLLDRISATNRPSLLMVHHPPQDGAASPQRALSDRKLLQELLKRKPVNLVLHGHLHYPTRATIDGAAGPIPVLGAASASTIGNRKSVAHYHLIDIDTDAGRQEITVRHYQYDRLSGRFTHSGSQSL